MTSVSLAAILIAASVAIISVMAIIDAASGK